MRRLALKQSPTAKVDEERSFLTTYRCRDRAWFFLYEELERPTRERHRYSKEDAARYAERWNILAITDKLKVKDLYHAALKGTLVDLQEGPLDVFSWDRLVLDLARLVTGLHRLLHGHPKGHVVDCDAIKAAFEEFQRVREKELHELQQSSATLTRLQAWATWQVWLIERWILPSLRLDKVLI
ncbi:hypothetical protein DL766_003129 [Monosporascus sp. MC13-8B]|uniref:Uncharacterized protein n=1 Tax=Monosporascus cannonballus TaxID=155416 RepID=A0ABY0H1C7_9PEZI|nr:hypothetical protein DL762_006670 [Monosporascus cannonballus]RYO94526.1 hypothetical protein DL763_004033 [Monosporascus cannonballus]RYP34141.1 hypothetical protein DL766_003129 [Monosporascus sp. MC13-8B]